MNGSKGAEYYALYNWLGKLSTNTNKIYNDIIGIFGSVKDAWEESGNAMLRNTCFSSETVTEKFYSEKLRSASRTELYLLQVRIIAYRWKRRWVCQKISCWIKSLH